jgi:RloB-like protein
MAQFPILEICGSNMARHSKSKFARGRKEPSKPTRKTYLIFCEGEKTEPNYFKAFRKGAKVEEFSVLGTGRNTKSIITYALRLRKLDDYAVYDEVWCVFDKDSFTPEQFNTAIQQAYSKNIKVAYTNQAFELWYLLHYEYCESALDRDSYKTRLTSYLRKEYEKNDPKMYEILQPKQADAIRNAKRLVQMHTSNSPAEHNPVTLVYELVEALNSPE